MSRRTPRSSLSPYTTLFRSAVVVMAGPCSVESAPQMREVAEAVKEAGARILRGGAYKPRTSPYAFQGLKEQGLRSEEHTSELQSLRHIVCRLLLEKQNRRHA